MRQVLGFQDCFVAAQKAAERARIWVQLCDIFKVDLGDDCIVVMCAVSEITCRCEPLPSQFILTIAATVEQLARLEKIKFLQEVANQKHQVLPLLRAIVPAFQYVLSLRETLSILPIENLDMSGDLIAKELADLPVTMFQEYFKIQSRLWLYLNSLTN